MVILSILTLGKVTSWLEKHPDAEEYRVPLGVSIIEAGAFKDCKSLKKVALPCSIRKIENSAFSGCSNLVVINFPEGLKVIGRDAFFGCSSLREIIIPRSLECMGARAFMNCSRLKFAGYDPKILKKSKDYKEYCKTIEPFSEYSQYSFCCFEHLNQEKSLNQMFDDINFDDKKCKKKVPLAFIPVQAFENCTNLKSAFFPVGPSSILNRAFFGCERLASVKFSQYLHFIGEKAFFNTGIQSIDMPCLEEKQSIVVSANFNDDVDEPFPEIVPTDDALCLTEELCASAEFSQSSNGKYKGTELTLVSKDAFGNCKNLTSVGFYYDTTSIKVNSSLFTNCKNLKTVNFGYRKYPYNCIRISISDKAFEGCCNLENLEYPKSSHAISNIGKNAFAGCTKLKLCDEDFRWIYKIDEYAFYGAKSIKSMKKPERLEEIGDYAFENSGIEDVCIPVTLKSLGDGAFLNCSSLENVSIDAKISRIPNMSFCDCKALKNINFPDSIEKIGINAFNGCKNFQLKSGLPKNLERIDINAFSDSGITKLSIPDSVEYIGAAAFANCKSLKSLTLSKKLTAINKRVFLNTSISKVHFPKSIKYIDNLSFANCGLLCSATSEEKIENIHKQAFAGSPVSNVEKISTAPKTMPEKVNTTVPKNSSNANNRQSVCTNQHSAGFSESISDLPSVNLPERQNPSVSIIYAAPVYVPSVPNSNDDDYNYNIQTVPTYHQENNIGIGTAYTEFPHDQNPTHTTGVPSVTVSQNNNDNDYSIEEIPTLHRESTDVHTIYSGLSNNQGIRNVPYSKVPTAVNSMIAEDSIKKTF